MGPLAGLKIVELAGIGPAPFCGMMLSDMGAEVIRIDRVSGTAPGVHLPRQYNVLSRGRKSIAIDLKQAAGVETVLRLVEQAEAFIEGFRPGVIERLGLGPEVLHARNPKLVIGRMTGWGQEGPIAHTAGHDINYIALSGTLSMFGRQGSAPTPPLNLIGDFGGGGMLLAFGVLAGIIEAQRSGQGQVIDAAMVDGAAVLAAALFGMHAQGLLTEERGTNMLDTGAHFYEVYECADGKYISIGSIEPQFYDELLTRTGVDKDYFADQRSREKWPEYKVRLAAVFKTKSRQAWVEIMQDSDVCFAPVLSPSEAPHHPHNQQRGTFVTYDGVIQPAPAPRFERTPPAIQGAVPAPGQHTDEILQACGFSADDIRGLYASGAVANAKC
jgi:alpha-methylacyl-CoA racemase